MRPDVLRFLPAAVCWLFSAGFLAMTYTLPPAARAMPLMVGWCTLGLATLDMASRLKGKLGEALMRTLNPAGLKPEPPDTVSGRYALLSGIGLVVLLVTAFLLFGALVAAPVLIFAALMIANRKEWLLSLAIAAGSTLVIWLLFSVLLRLQLYPGVLFGGSL
ncbi:MAG: tripartite tricarboxylate transporter TctB family protein [Caulobacteraceae bacterium]